MKTRLLLIRHGETDWTKRRRYCGSNDIPLNSRGRNQARRLGKKLAAEAIDAVYCSDLSRASGFARIALKGRKIKPHRGLREMNFGIFEGLTHAALNKKYKEQYSSWLKDFKRYTPPGAEKFSAFQKRVKKTFREIIAQNRGKTCAIVSHGGPLMVLFTQAQKKKTHWKFLPATGNLSVIEITGRKMDLTIFNDTGK